MSAILIKNDSSNIIFRIQRLLGKQCGSMLFAIWTMGIFHSGPFWAKYFPIWITSFKYQSDSNPVTTTVLFSQLHIYLFAECTCWKRFCPVIMQDLRSNPYLTTQKRHILTEVNLTQILPDFLLFLYNLVKQL